MSGLDIFKPEVSVIAKGIEGKVVTIYGSNNLGKSKQSSRMTKPLYLPFEKGLNAIAGVNFMPINSWGDFKKVNKQTFPKTLKKQRKCIRQLL